MIWDDLKYDKDGLIPVITQDHTTGEVLMLAYAKKEQVQKTLETGETHYYSRSRDVEWHKGETSGNVQHLVEVRVDCDLDAILYLVEQQGNACHTGEHSCFYRGISRKGEMKDE
ncbi:MAG: phosphoribosyl-AMP cyclohydrolase [Clostridia bacterium]